MTDDDKAMVERLRLSAREDDYAECRYRWARAADRIEDLSAENKRMREALEKDVARFEACADMISDGPNPSGTLRVERFLKSKQYATEARAALGDTK